MLLPEDNDLETGEELPINAVLSCQTKPSNKNSALLGWYVN